MAEPRTYTVEVCADCGKQSEHDLDCQHSYNLDPPLRPVRVVAVDDALTLIEKWESASAKMTKDEFASPLDYLTNALNGERAT